MSSVWVLPLASCWIFLTFSTSSGSNFFPLFEGSEKSNSIASAICVLLIGMWWLQFLKNYGWQVNKRLIAWLATINIFYKE